MKKRLLRCASAALPGLALAVLLLWLGAEAPARADPGVRYVAPPPTGSDAGNDCTNPSQPCATIQHGVDVADPWDSILVADGTYTSGVGTVGAITKALWIEGAYAPDFGGGPDPDLYETVLDGQWGGSVISITDAADVGLTHLTLTHGDGTDNCGSGLGRGGGVYAEGTNVHIGHCIITGNVANTAGINGRGGGIYVDANGRMVDIWNSQIVSNTANTDPSSSYVSWGGGIYIQYGTVSLVENQFLDNVGSDAGASGKGGGILLYGVTQADVLTNTVRGNRAGVGTSGGGGGLCVYAFSSSVYVASNRIENNWTSPDVTGEGGGVLVADSDTHLAHNTIIGNATGDAWMGPGGGVYIASHRPVTLSNNLIAHNEASVYGGGVYVSWYVLPASHALLVNNTIADNGDSGVTARYYADLTMINNLIAGHTTGLTTLGPFTGTISADTNLFWNTSDPITGSNAIVEDPLLMPDYRLRAGSPAVDAGLTIPWLTTDLEGKARPQGSGYDIGAFEGEVWWDVYLPLVVRNAP
jgi:hypothetical protein